MVEPSAAAIRRHECVGEQTMPEPKSYRLLVVDDQPEILKTIEIMLRESPFDIVATTSGQEALEIAEQNTFDVALLDILMPDISGIALAVRLQRFPHLSNMAVVMLTAVNDRQLHRRAEMVGTDELLLKPIGKKALIERLQAAVDKYALPEPVSEETEEE
jgi:CheY-like chemotaxis protein